MENDILLIHNDLIRTPLTGLSPREKDLLKVLLLKLQQNDSALITLDYAELKTLTGMERKADEEFLSYLTTMNQKLQQIKIHCKSSTDEIDMVIFPTIHRDKVNRKVTIYINEHFRYFIFGLTGDFTIEEYLEYSSLRSGYAKDMYDNLKRFRDTGLWCVKIEDYRHIMDIPPSYKMCHIDQKIIEPSLKELMPYFNNLGYVKTYESGRGKRVKTLEFAFDKQPYQEQSQPKQPKKIKPKSKSEDFDFLDFTLQQQTEEEPDENDLNIYPQYRPYIVNGRELTPVKSCPACGNGLFVIAKKDGTFLGHLHAQLNQGLVCTRTESDTSRPQYDPISLAKNQKIQQANEQKARAKIIRAESDAENEKRMEAERQRIIEEYRARQQKQQK